MTLAKKMARVRALIDSCELDVPFTRRKLLMFSQLTGLPLRAAKKVANPWYPNDKRHVVVKLRGKPGWHERSWVRALRHTHRGEDAAEARNGLPSRSKLHRALRQAIQGSLDGARNRMLDRGECCAQRDSREDLTCDHTLPPFKDIARWFLQSHYVELAEARGRGDVMADESVRRTWIRFHSRCAEYQLLCRQHNSAKGSKRCG